VVAQRFEVCLTDNRPWPNGSIVTLRRKPGFVWGIDATGCLTGEGQRPSSSPSTTASPSASASMPRCGGTRFEALEPLRQGVREHFGGYLQDIATGLSLRHDHGSQFCSRDFQAELGFLGITSSPAYVREPEGNGCAERFIRTLKEQLLWVRRFDTVEELLRALHQFRDLYNREWLIERHGHRSPAAMRQALLEAAAA